MSESPLVPVVGLGASAGGLKAATSFLEALPGDLGLAYVLVQHLAPDHTSELHRLLRTHTPMPVHQVHEAVTIEPNTVYVIPPGRVLTIEKERLAVSERVDDHLRRFPIDQFFRSLAQARKDESICIVLSGTGTDGTLGLKAVKEEAGLCLVQDPSQAEYDGMPRSAIATGLVDVVAPIQEIAKRLESLPDTSLHPDGASSGFPTDVPEETLQKIFVELYRQTGHHFEEYKRATILRRLARRMQIVEMNTAEAYVEHLKNRPKEAQALFKDILISVTSFFRDPKAFEALATRVIPELFERKAPDDTVRVWVPGCATGEEAVSIAMLLLEHQQNASLSPNIQVFATDVDTEALDFARRGAYPSAIASDVSPKRISRFFKLQDNGYHVSAELTDRVLFAEHNVISDPPFSRLDLISCRNLLIYLNRGLQERIFARLHYALKPDGYLFLGRSESPESVSNLFQAIDVSHHIYERLNVPTRPDRTLDLPVKPTRIPREAGEPVDTSETLGVLHETLVAQSHAPPSVLVNADGHVVHVTGDVSRFVRVRKGVASFRFLDMVASALRPSLRPALFRAMHGDRTSIQWRGPLTDLDDSPPSTRLTVKPTPGPTPSFVADAEAPDLPASLLRLAEGAEEKASDDGTPREPRLVPTETDGRDQSPSNGSDLELTMIVEPVEDQKTDRKYVLVVFDERSLSNADWHISKSSPEEQEMYASMEDELQKTQHRMRTLIEEYDTSTEELQTSNEELQSMNEELRSATEELQIRKEELQSANEELLTVNTELKTKVEEVNQANADLENLLVATDIGTLYLTRTLTLKRYTPQALRLFDIHVRDIGTPFHQISHRLNEEDVAATAKQVYETLQPVRREVTAGDQTHLMHVMPYRTPDDRIDGVVLTFVDVTDRAELRTERDAAAAASEMKSKMIANLSHEVRTPMTALLGFSEALKEEALTGDVQRFGEIIHKSSVRLQNTLESVLHFARLDAGKEVLDTGIVNVVEEVLETYTEQQDIASSRGIEFRLDIAPTLREDESVWCETNPGAIQRILRNLTGNAIKYTPPGGRVELRCTAGRAGVMVEVEDSGIGMSSAFQGRMFEPFSQESEGRSREFEGVGLGLAIVRKLTELVGGRLEVESTPGQGTRFALFLPRHDPAS